MCAFWGQYGADIIRYAGSEDATCTFSVLYKAACNYVKWFFVSRDWSVASLIDATTLRNGQIPLCRLPRDVRDKPVTSPLAQIPLRRLPRNFPGRGSFEGVGVMEFGLNVARDNMVT